MIYFATIHWKTDKWIDLQLKYLNRYLLDDYKVYACLNDIDRKHYSKFFFVDESKIRQHGEKLNLLADKIIKDKAKDDDILVFMDGDAFPICDITDFMKQKLEKYPLFAIQRIENNGDVIPHPSFCATTINFWKKIKGDWTKGYLYQTDMGYYITDVGGKIYEYMCNHELPWYALLRTNKKNFHPLFYGVYDNLIYHHGAGFRECVSSVDLNKYGFHRMKKRILKIGNYKFPFNLFYKPLFFLVRKYGNILRRLVHYRNKKLSKNVYSKLLAGDGFINKLRGI